MDDANRFAPPSPDAAESGDPTGPLFSAGQIVFATLLGGPMAGCLLAGSNARRLPTPATRPSGWLVGGAIATVLVAVAALWLPETVPGILLTIVYTVAMHLTVEALSGPTVGAYLDDGHPRGSWWALFAAALAGIVALVVVGGTLAVFVDG